MFEASKLFLLGNLLCVSKYFKDFASYSSEGHSGRVIATMLLWGQQEQSVGTGEGGTQDA